MKNILPCIFLILSAVSISAQVLKAPDRSEGDGPFHQLIIRGVTIINGNGAPPIGPADIVIENNKIAQIKMVGYPGVPIDDKAVSYTHLTLPTNLR